MYVEKLNDLGLSRIVNSPALNAMRDAECRKPRHIVKDYVSRLDGRAGSRNCEESAKDSVDLHD